MVSRNGLCMKEDILLSAKKSRGFQHCFAFPPLCCFLAERNPVSPLHSLCSEPILPAAPGTGLPGTVQRVRDRSKSGTKNVPAKARVPARSPELNRKSREPGRETSQSCFLKEIYRDTVKQGGVRGEGRLDKLIANQQDCHKRLQPTTDFHRATPNPKLSPADQLGAATASSLSVPLRCKHNYSITPLCPSKRSSYSKLSFLFLCVP